MSNNNIYETFSSIKEMVSFYEELGIDFLTGTEKDSRPIKIEEPGIKVDTLSLIQDEVLICRACSLHINKTNFVFGEGSDTAPIMFIGAAPNSEEDSSGRPFSGKAGELLTKIISAMGYNRSDMYVTNIIKCKPDESRTSLPDETDICISYIKRQIAVIKPEIICTLGSIATNLLLNNSEDIINLRGNIYNYNGIKLIPTFHPAYLLKNESEKKVVWEDMQQIMKLLKMNNQ